MRLRKRQRTAERQQTDQAMKSYLSLLLASVLAFALVAGAGATELSITAANVVPSSGAKIKTGTAGATITAGQLVYVDTADSFKLKLSDCNSGTSAVRDVDGLAINGASAGQQVSYVTFDPALTIGATTANGTIYVLGATAGGIAPAADITTGWYVAVIGLGLPSNKLYFNAGGAPNELRTTTAQ